MKPVPTRVAENAKPAYELRLHFGWYTTGRMPLFQSPRVGCATKEHLADNAARHQYHVLEAETEPTVLRARLSLRPDQCPTRVGQTVRGILAKYLGDRLGLDNLWSRGFFVRSIGDVAADAVR
jgi:REP element-mobilizing transposase RayT